MADTGSYDVAMPQLGETVTEGTITRWFKKVGESVAEDEPLFEVSTDKVDSEVPAALAGYVTEILVEEGQTVDVGTKLAVINGQPPANGSAASASSAPAVPLAERVEDEVRTVVPEPEPELAPEPEPKPAPRAPGGEARSGRKVLSPLVRRLLAEHDLEADDIQGTGIEGRVTRNDVMAHLDHAGSRGPAAKPSPVRPSAAAPAVITPRAGGADEVIPFSNIRKRTAEHMVRSQATSAHVLTAVEVDFDAVDRVRLVEKDAFKAEEGFSLTYLPFVSRAVIDAIRDFPHVNASVGDNQLIIHRAVHLGIAVDLNFEGLIVPVIPAADQLDVPGLATAINDLAGRARSGRLRGEDVAGGTFTLSNPGPFGARTTLPIINQPQVAIVTADAIAPRPVAVPDTTHGHGGHHVAIRPIGNLTLAWDHRAFDGAYAASALSAIRAALESHDWDTEFVSRTAVPGPASLPLRTESG
jgi:2-oxoglutarate dehydrogenase E2 component (dihydrolipoamide succinyltransferase)